MEHNRKEQVEYVWIHHLDCMYIVIWHLWKKYSFLFFWFLIKKGTGLAGSRWLLLIIIHMPLQINSFTLIYVNSRVRSFYRINENKGWFYCSYISSIYLKRFWGNFKFIPRIYKYEVFTDPLKFINQIRILNKFSMNFSRNMLNPLKLPSCTQTEFLTGMIL